MGVISSLLENLSTSTNNKIYSGSEFKSTSANQILAVVRPIGRFCRIFGVFPLSFVTLSDTVYLQTKRGAWYFWSVFIFLVTTCYMIFQTVSLILCIHVYNRPILQLTAQSIWLIYAIPPYLLSIFMFVRGKALVELFEDWCAIERELERLFCPVVTRRHVHRFSSIYAVMSIVSIVLCGYHAIYRPMAPVYPFFYMTEYTEWHHFAYVIFQLAILAWVWAGFCMLEGTCCLFATVITQCMTTLVLGLEFTFNTTAEKGEQNDYTESVPNATAKNHEQNHEQFMRTAVHSILMKNAVPTISGGGRDVDETDETLKDPFKTSGIEQNTKIHKEDYLLFVVRKLQTVGNLQTKVNRILGPLLLVDVGELVILVCILIFLPIRYSHKMEGFEVAVTFLGNGITVLARLILFVVSLGSVYSKGQDVNVALAKAMISTRMGTTCQNPVLAHLSVFSSNPISFTAWDFFPITRGTLLAAFSLISTYAIVFLQINF